MQPYAEAAGDTGTLNQVVRLKGKAAFNSMLKNKASRISILLESVSHTHRRCGRPRAKSTRNLLKKRVSRVETSVFICEWIAAVWPAPIAQR
ncbi:hypothetical protein COMA2_10044 [Candidatus Nitrospira nitrificans]|uniref:Uncharacterized protein n=1 Tax=Candidatus Nitrospira nitrificans TaxID=1742973 RepID=A0A0S4L3N0_9BACT|nr:hypothetical protein COMA2_10044 [Candidatus Nitrospira nitrificans]